MHMKNQVRDVDDRKTKICFNHYHLRQHSPVLVAHAQMAALHISKLPCHLQSLTLCTQMSKVYFIVAVDDVKERIFPTEKLRIKTDPISRSTIAANRCLSVTSKMKMILKK